MANLQRLNYLHTGERQSHHTEENLELIFKKLLFMCICVSHVSGCSQSVENGFKSPEATVVLAIVSYLTLGPGN